MAAIAYVCKSLCTKSMYTAEERGSRALLEPSDTAVFWCNKTGGAMGPDQDIAGPHDCGDTRSCYVLAPVLMAGPAD